MFATTRGAEVLLLHGIVSEPARQAPRRRYRRRAIVLVDVLQVKVYVEMVAQDRVTAPIPCPDGCDGQWGRHSRFERQWVDYDCVAYTVVVLRVRCSVCRGVWSLFPGFVWYRFRFSYRLVQSACWKVLSGTPGPAVAEQLAAQLSPLVKQSRVPAESTIRSWIAWLGQRWLVRMVRWTLSLIARRSVEGARAALPVIEAPPALTPAVRVRRRAERVLRGCAALDAVVRGRTNLARRSPYQLRDWARALFCERRQPLARPP